MCKFYNLTLASPIYLISLKEKIKTSNYFLPMEEFRNGA